MPPGGEPAAVGESAGEQAPAIRTSVVSIFESVKNKRASIVVADGSADGNASPVAPANARASAEDQDEGKIQSSADNEFGGGAGKGGGMLVQSPLQHVDPRQGHDARLRQHGQ